MFISINTLTLVGIRIDPVLLPIACRTIFNLDRTCQRRVRLHVRAETPDQRRRQLHHDRLQDRRQGHDDQSVPREIRFQIQSENCKEFQR